MLKHPLEPIYNQNSKILILGSFPSPKSRQEMFYYANKSNRFWQVLGRVFREPVPQSEAEKKDFILKHQLALFDVIKACDIQGASDSSITNVEVNDISKLLKTSKIEIIYTTGRKAYDLYNKYCLPLTEVAAVYLPSTSGANAAMSLEDLVLKYQVLNNNG